MIERIKEVSVQLKAFRLAERKPLANRKIDVALTWPTNVASHIADISSPGHPPGPSDHVRCLGRSTESKTQESTGDEDDCDTSATHLFSLLHRSPWPKFPQQAKDAT